MPATRRELLTALAASGSAWTAPSNKPPNVVLIISDDHGWTDYGFLGHKHVRTPNIDRIAREGLTLTRGYVPASLCRPSLASMMTGLYPHQHRITGNDPPGDPKDAENRARMVRIFQQSGTIAALLGKAGYVSHQSGKWWEGECKCGGFDECMTHGDVARGGRHGDEGLKIGRETMQPVVDFIDRTKADGKPFFVWYAPFLPHTPHTPPERLLRRFETLDLPPKVATYYANIGWLDETVGQLLDHLDRNGLTENTLVVYLADNGWIQGADALPYQNRAKLSPYDAGVRTPILLRWPGRIKPERDDSSLASSVDLATTILPVCGVKPPAAMPGLDLTRKAALRKRDAVYGSIFTHNSIDIERPERNLKYRWIVEGRHKLIAPHAPNQARPIWETVGALRWAKDSIELFDIVSDPAETRDLASAQPQVVKRLLAKLDGWWTPPPTG